MFTFNTSIYISLIRKFFILLIIILPLANAYIVNGQNNANSINSNIGNLNVNVNRNANSNTNVNTNANLNSGTNANTSVNSNTNQNSNTSKTNGNNNQSEDNRRNKLSDSPWFFGLTFLIFGVVLIPFVFIIYRSIRFSGATYRSPLGLPEGSLRAILAYMLVAFLGFYVLASILSLTEFSPPQFLLGIVATVIGFYFGARTGEDKAAGARTAGVIQGNVTDKSGASSGGANIELSQSTGEKHTQKADANGKFKFDNVSPGDYDIQASLTGHQPSDIAKVKITAGATQTVNLSLK